ncbi:MAG TPA: DUF3330 domain-containing protein [Gammaproteobacteria bacterium]|nr:DUF3330 domain-containing protein [Gammaproteobacteria bacterium]
MNKPDKTTETGQVSCEVCLKEIPISEAESDEALGYVVHFCGLECHEKWRTQQEKNEE